MAKILLNVQVDKAGLQQAQREIDRVFSPKSSGGFGGAKTQVDNLQKSAANLLNTIKSTEDKYSKGLFDGLRQSAQRALKDITELNKEIGDGKPTEAQKKRFAELKKEVSQTSAGFATLRAESQKLQKENKLAIPNVDNLRKKYANLLTTIQGTEKYYKKGTFSKLTEDIKGNLTSLQNLDPTTKEYAQTVNDLDKALNALQREFAETKANSDNMHGSFMEIVQGFLKFQASAMVVMAGVNAVRNTWNSLNETLVETENRLIEIRRVVGDVANSDELYHLAQRYGQTFENVSEITLNFARNGMEWADALKATEAALLAINVAELDATQASDGMIAIMQQYGYEASQLESIVDKLNITADNAAVTTQKLLTALQRTGSSAKNANLDLEETVGIVTALSEATGRSGENLGTAINSLIQFSTKESSLNTFAKLGGDVEKTVELYRQGGATVLDIWKQLSSVIKNTQTAEGILGENFTTEEFEALNDELKEALGEEFAKTTEIYDTASTFRRNYFIALLNNLDKVEETLETMRSSQGYSQKENEQYLDTYEAKVNKLEAKWQEIANDEQGLLAIKKSLVDSAIVLLEIFDTLGGVQSLVFGISGALLGGGWGALIGVGLGAINSAIYDYQKSEEQSRDLAISNWQANQQQAESLQKLYDKYQQLTPADNEFLTVQKDLVTALGDKANLLEDLTVGTDEYATAVKNLTNAELRRYKQQQTMALDAAEENAKRAKIERETFGSGGYTEFSNGSKGYINNIDELILQGAGVGYKTNTKTSSYGGNTKYTSSYGLSGVVNAKTAEESYNNYLIYKDAAEKVWDYYEQALIKGDDITATNALDLYKEIFSIVEKYETDFETYGKIKGSLDWINEQENGGGGGGSASTNLSDIASTLREIKENTDKANELEERQLALQEAKNQRTVRVFNSATGQWEQVANQSAIDEAEGALKDTALNNVISVLENGKLPEGYELPEWLTNLVAPTEEQQFASFLTSMGILTGIMKNGGSLTGTPTNSTSNVTNNNQTYSLNGIPIPAQDAGRYFTPEALELLNQMG